MEIKKGNLKHQVHQEQQKKKYWKIK